VWQSTSEWITFELLSDKCSLIHLIGVGPPQLGPVHPQLGPVHPQLGPVHPHSVGKGGI